MTGYQILALVGILYLLFELGAIPLGHAIGKRVSGTRIVLIIMVGCYLLWFAYAHFVLKVV